MTNPAIHTVMKLVVLSHTAMGHILYELFACGLALFIFDPSHP